MRQSAKREKLPDVLELAELKKLLAELENPARALVFLTAATGLRVSEALGLKWSDVDFAAGEIRLSRAVVHQHVDALQDWSRQAPYRQTGDWVFASPDMDGKQSYWPETPLRCYVHPAAKRVGITKVLGWHSFRRTFATLLKGGGEDVKTAQELMRHANSRLTLDVYAQALTPAKRAAHLKLVELIHPAAGTAIGPSWSHAEDAVAVSS
ncbi:MAG: hypothetical protein QOJ41_1970 [Acidobacteriaceae bacterium]|nr:hypothetical protein [Acidobacteriaceae bacterium]